MDKISIIIPVYNAQKHLKNCIESLLCQTYSNIEMIFVDDGSSDRSLEIICTYAAKHSSIQWIHKENGGVASARNIGMQKVSGKYVLFLDSDD